MPSEVLCTGPKSLPLERRNIKYSSQVAYLAEMSVTEKKVLQNFQERRWSSGKTRGLTSRLSWPTQQN
jgi:hypothetical protein